MAFMQMLSVGYPQALVQNQIYAMPNKTVIVACNTSLNFSNDPAMASVVSTVAAVTNTGGFISSFAFVQSAATNSVITCKPY